MTVDEIEEALVALRDGRAVDGYRCVGLVFSENLLTRSIGEVEEAEDHKVASRAVLDKQRSVLRLYYDYERDDAPRARITILDCGSIKGIEVFSRSDHRSKESPVVEIV